MSKSEVMRFFNDVGNNPEMAKHLEGISKKGNPVFAAYVTGKKFKYSFTQDEFVDAAPEMHARYQKALEESVALAGRRWSEGTADRMGWHDGAAGAALGNMINYYWEKHSDDWGVATPGDWLGKEMLWPRS